MSAIILRAQCTAGTTHNNYAATVTPSLGGVIPEGLVVVWKPDVTNVDTLVSQVFTGTGIDDAVFFGPYVGTSSGAKFEATIDALSVLQPDGSSVDTFKWRIDAGAYTTGVPITASLQSLIQEISITYANTTGHTIGDKRVLTVETPPRFSFEGTNDLMYRNEAGSLKALSGGDLPADIQTELLRNSGSWLLVTPSLPVLVGQIPPRPRKELIANYIVTGADTGTVLSGTGDFTYTMPAPPTVVNKFFWFKNKGTSGVQTLDAGAYKFYGLGTSTLDIYPGQGLQLEVNGVDWEVLATTGDMFKVNQQTLTADTTKTIPNILPGKNYQMIIRILKNTDGVPQLRFNADAGNNYNRNIIYNAAGIPVSDGATETAITLAPTLGTTYEFYCTVFFSTWLSDDTKVLVNWFLSGHVAAATFMGLTGSAEYTGGSALTSVALLNSAGTMTGDIKLYQLG